MAYNLVDRQIGPMDKDRLKKRRELRQAFLERVYEEADGHVNEFVDGLAIGARLGADPDEARRVIAYFEEKQLLVVDDHKTGLIRITAAGIDVIESGA